MAWDGEDVHVWDYVVSVTSHSPKCRASLQAILQLLLGLVHADGHIFRPLCPPDHYHQQLFLLA